MPLFSQVLRLLKLSTSLHRFSYCTSLFSWSHSCGSVYREAGMVDPNAIFTMASSPPVKAKLLTALARLLDMAAEAVSRCAGSQAAVTCSAVSNLGTLGDMAPDPVCAEFCPCCAVGIGFWHQQEPQRDTEVLSVPNAEQQQAPEPQTWYDITNMAMQLPAALNR